ncbi:DUF1540 domain-containing protein [Sinanaerobacter chloroacetimidivorans]|uniref:DUF1540 domain-containing protein n=1 Tax=Sinanaerobacter chloroacetimidivorans TaxID=2818044 RepID=A0A8J7VZB7_9FIRM|nr:DUF1540 domain-containing protein [Sinanaerobacter chloroacetimidivorans]MBR0597912.1 DUF1540 domain-containing protein [Sinanaerobacter chloroacetimidivorans]
MDKKMPVKCSVTNCQYNDNKMCVADSIEVNAMGDGRARTSDGTCCTTFVSSKSNSAF